MNGLEVQLGAKPVAKDAEDITDEDSLRPPPEFVRSLLAKKWIRFTDALRDGELVESAPFEPVNPAQVSAFERPLPPLSSGPVSPNASPS